MDVFGGAPRVLGYPRPVAVRDGMDAQLKCQIGGDPQPDVVWERKNVPLLSEGRYSISQEGKAYFLCISCVTAEDSGQYICKAKNSIGETCAAAMLKVENESQEVLVVPPPQPQSQLQQQPLQNGNIEPEQQLQRDPKAEQQQQKELDFENRDRPRFLIKPLSLRVDRGEDAAFSCKLTGEPLPEVIWEKDGKRLKEIFESSHFRVCEQDGGWYQLKVFRTRAPDGGVYTCRAANEHGQTVAGAVLLVEPVPETREEKMQNGYANGYANGLSTPTPGSPSSSHSKDRHHMAKHSKEPLLNVAKAKKFAVSEGKHAKFRCYVTGKPKPEIVWKKDGVPLDIGRRHMIFEDREGYFTLKVLYCKQQDSGLYVCAASNALGNTLSAVQLSVKGPPVRFKRGLRDVEVRERDVAVLECEVPEDSVPISWYLEDQRLHPNSKYDMEQRGTRRRLTIHDIGVDDDGVYLCEMADGGKSIAELSVKGTIVRKLPRKLEVLEGENAAFCVEVDQEDMEVYWYKDGTHLRETHQTIIKSFGRTHILVFVNTSYQDSGTITFVAGRSKNSSRLKVKAARHSAPPCPVGVNMNAHTANGAVLSWEPAPNLQKGTKTVYVLERQEVGSQEWRKCLSTEATTSVEVLGESVPCEGDYRFRVCCVNKYGRSGHVEFPKVIRLVPGPKIKTPLTNVVVTGGDDAVFSIELSATMIGTWFLNSTQLQDSENFTLRQNQQKHSLHIRSVRDIYNGAEITFIASGVRDSAILQVEPREVKFDPLTVLETDKKVEMGDPIVLYCEVSHPSAKVRWFKDGVELQMEDGLNIQSEGNMRRIVIQSSEYSHSGEYTCKALGDTLTFNVEVEAGRAMFAAVPEKERNKFVEGGDSITLQCGVSDPSAEVHWFKDGEPVVVQDGVEIQAQGNQRTLVIQSADFHHAGMYTCQSSDDVSVFQVDITGPPVTIKEIPEEDCVKTAMELDPVVLYCEVTRPDAAARWTKDGVEVQASDIVTVQAEGVMRRLIIRSADLQDAGTYTCHAGDSSMSFTVNIKEPPVMIVDPKDDIHLDRYLSEEIVLNCELSRSSGVARWFKDGLEVRESENVRVSSEGPYRRLTILCGLKEDSGEYVCDTGGDSVFFQLSVTAAPVRFVSPRESEVEMVWQAGERVELSCELSCAKAEVCWFRDGLEVDEADGLVLEVDGAHRRLVIPCSCPEDTGEYLCESADDSVTFLLTVEEPPVQLTRPKQAKSVVDQVSGEPLVLECEVSRENAEVRWLKDGVELELDGDVTVTEEGLIRRLTILSPSGKDSGKYTCDAGGDAIDFKVNVKQAPVKILRKEEIETEHNCVVSDDVELECELSRASGKACWYKDGERLEENERFCVEEEGAFRSLIILNVDLEDSGEYFLDVLDDNITFMVKVQEPPVTIVGNSDDPEYQEMVSGDDLILAIEVSRANAPVEWYCNEKRLVEDSRTHIETYGTLRKLIITDIKSSDSGKYMCDAVNDKMATVVRVKEPPITILNKEEVNKVTGYEGEGVTLNVVLSREKPVVKWMKDWTEVNNERYRIGYNGVTHYLTIDPLRRSDSGEYTCDVGTDEMQFSLLVKEMRVKFTKSLHNTVAYKDGMITLRCEVCKAKADVLWLKDGEEVIPSRRFSIRANELERSLTIHRVTKEDAGEYSCESRDDCTRAYIRVELPREVEFVTELHNTTVLEGDDATFKCVVSPEDAEVVWLMDNEPITSGDRFVVSQNGLCHTLVIRRCQILDSARITAESEGVTSKASLKIQEAQILFTKRAEPVEGEEFGESTLETEISLETGEVQWMRQSVVIQTGVHYTLSQSGRKRRLTVHNLGLSDRGTYRCETLHDRTQVKLNVEPRKVFLRKSLKDMETFERETASFEVELSHADVEGVWQKDGLRIKPNNNWRVSMNGCVHGLTMSNLSLEDTGTIVFSSDGLRTSARLQVKEPPVTILRKLTDLSFEEGSPVTLECELSRPNVDAKWFRNDMELKVDKNHRIYSMGRKRFLQILESSIGDSGSYKCEIGELSTFCNLNIFEHALEIIQGIEDLHIQEDQNAVFMCELSLEDVPGDWYKDEHKLKPTSTIKIRREGTKHFLLICNVTAEDTGEIKFVARQLESIACLEVEDRPASIVKPLRDRTALQKHRVILECTVSTPRCVATWYCGQTELETSDRMEITSDGCCRRLVIHQVALEDEGTYSVEVGEHTSTAKLLVEGQSILLVRELEDVEVTAPDQACFECELSMPLLKTPVWTLDGETLQNSSEVRLETQGAVHKLTFKKTSEDMSGEVRFTVGKAKSCAQLTVN
ncbi:obscurin-like protein 1a [Clupea harengus]|uniref:Obscurin-like protein 1a n=1 Tax=Clupea harengus TaxID=7950 RepID=A0A6P8ES96_CLUHA|nr:obscurin-like protein 1a [Clupea harengus]